MKITIELDTIGEAVRVIEALNGLPIGEPIDTTEPVEPVTPEAEPARVAPQPTDRNADVDANGIPWDKRIHARTKVIKADGTWRQKRGVDPALVEQVTAELKGGAPAPAEIPPPPPPPPPAADAMPEDFPSFMKWVVGQDKKYNETDALNELVAQVGLPSIGLLAVNKHHIPTLVEIVKHGK